MRTKFIAVLATLIFLLVSVSSASAKTDIGTEKKLGVGIGGGSLTYGLSVKSFMDEKSAIIASLGANYGFSAEAGYLRTVMSLYEGPTGNVDLSVGGTAMVWMWDTPGVSQTIFGGRGILEFSFKFATMPLEITAEWGPAFFTGAGTFAGLYLGGGGGAFRWYF